MCTTQSHSQQAHHDRARETLQPRESCGRRHVDNYRGRTQSSDSSIEYSPPNQGTQSGIDAKPTSNIREQLRYPHFSLGQVSAFIGQNLQFHNLTYEQFIVGELTTISQCEDHIEREGRTELLQRITLWRLRANVTWSQVRSAYGHIIRKLENKEINWFADWD